MTSTRAKSRAVFIDRDGTIMHDADYCSDPKQVQVFEGAGAALSRLKNAGYKIIVITNQSGIGRGFFTEKQYRTVEAEVSRQLGNDFRRCGQILSHPIGATAVRHFVEPRPNTDRADASIVGALDVDLLVADQKGMPEIDIVVAGRFKNHPRRRLPAF